MYSPTIDSPCSDSASKKVYSCRFIPCRTSSRLELSLLPNILTSKNQAAAASPASASSSQMMVGEKADDPSFTYHSLLKNQLLGVDAEKSSPCNLFQYGTEKSSAPSFDSHDSAESRIMQVKRKRAIRRIPKKPIKVLDAPALQDDFYLNVIDWSANNVLAVGLSEAVYLWNAVTSKVVLLCDLSETADSVSSVCWSANGNTLAVGTGNGEVQLWDVTKGVQTALLEPQRSRVGTLSWCGMLQPNILASGSRDRSIFVRDVRARGGETKKLIGHKQEVCGLKWSPDDVNLASGGNDNWLMLWHPSATTNHVHRFEQHTAAVKALSWSPHQYGLLASGGGTADRCIRFWNTITHHPIHQIDTGSQVCNIAWSKNSVELVSTHGYSQNQVLVWKYPSMTKLATLSGHTLRVLYLATSPDGETVVTGAGDETLRFWNIFPSASNRGTNSADGNVFNQRSHSSIR